MTNEVIVLKQLPIIENQLQQVKEQVDARAKEAVSLVCTEGTRKDVKAVRTALRKEFDEFEQQRKVVKSKILAPYEEFEKVYQECVSNAYQDADTILKEKIDAVEDELKEKKATEIKAYFAEGRCSRGIPDGIAGFEISGIRVTLSASVSSLKKDVDAYLNRVSGELKYIQSLVNADEIMVEYRKSLNVIDAVEIVTARHEMLKAEQERRTAKEETPAQPETEDEMSEETSVSIALRVTGTAVQIEALKAFLNSGGYQFNMIRIGGTGNG